MVYLASDGLFVTYQRTNFNPTLIIKCIFQPPVRSFSTGYQALGFLGIQICPLGMTFSSKKLKNASTQIFLTVTFGFSQKFLHVVLARWHSSIGSSTFHLPNSQFQTLRIYQYKMIPSFSSHRNFCHNLETLLCPMLLHDLDVLKCAYRCHCLSHNSLHCVCVGFLSHQTIAMSPQYSRNCRFHK